MSSLKDIKKELYVKYLDSLRLVIYRDVLNCNNVLVHALYKKKRGSNLTENPLWLFHGGELINLYSTKKNRVPTKDIDLKLYMTGDYSIEPKSYKSACSKLQVSLNNYDFYDTKACTTQLSKDLRGFKGVLSKVKMPAGKTAFDVWKMGERQKIEMCVSLCANDAKGVYSQLNLNTGKVTDGYALGDLEKCLCQKWHGERYKAFIVNVPYVTQVSRDNVPYDINDKQIYKMGSDYDEDIDGYPIDEQFLEQLDAKLRVWHEDPRLQTKRNKVDFLTNALWAIRCKHQRFKLSTVVGVMLLYNESRGEWYMFQEGVLDLYNDYSAGHHSDYEKRYLGRYEDGSFPTVLRNISMGNMKGPMKFPALSWMVFDQLRMLYITLKDSYPDCKEGKCVWKKLGGGAAGNSEKYFRKLLGLLKSYESTINNLQQKNTMKDSLKTCQSYNLETCGSQAFLNSLFAGFAMNPKVKSHKKTQKVSLRNKKRGRSRKKNTTRKAGKKVGNTLSKNLKDKEANFDYI